MPGVRSIGCVCGQTCVCLHALLRAFCIQRLLLTLLFSFHFIPRVYQSIFCLCFIPFCSAFSFLHVCICLLFLINEYCMRVFARVGCVVHDVFFQSCVQDNS